MAQFRGTVQGTSGESSRLGSKKSGLNVEANGWSSGIHVQAFVNDDGQDCFNVFLTTGSKGWGDRHLIATVVDGELA